MIINANKCTCCMLCVKKCPEGAFIGFDVKQPPVIDISRCTGCNACRSVCEFQAISLVVYTVEADLQHSGKSS